MESEELARKGAAQDKGQECKEDSARPVFGEASKVESAERRENEYFVEQDAVLPIAQPTSEPGLTCSGLDAGMEIEDFINETVEEGKSDKVSEQQLVKSTTIIEKSLTTTQPSTATTPGSENVTEKVAEVVIIDQDQEVEKSEGGKPQEGPTKLEQSQTKVVEVAVTLTAGENEETIDGAALKSMQLEAGDGSDKGTATPNSTSGQEKETVEDVGAAPKVNAKAPKSCVVNMASDDNRGKKDGQKGGAKSNGRSKKNQADQTVVVVEGEAPATATAAKPPAKRGRKPGSKRAEKAAPDNTSKSRSSSGEPKAPPVTLDLTTQPFSDAQQVQLRAQILVYGAIIQGSVADETLMGAAFTDISKVSNLESFESQAGSSRSLWEKAWKTASERMVKAAGKFGGRNSPPAPRPPPSNLSPTNLPKSPSSRGKKSGATPPPAVTPPSTSEFPSVSPVATSVMTMASATVASWNSARARAPSPMGSAVDSWLYRSSFPFGQHLNLSASPAPQQPPSQWGVPSQLSTPIRGGWGVFSQASFGSQPPPFPLFSSPHQAMPPPAAVAALEADRGKGTGKRKRLDDSESTPAPASSSQVIPSDVSPATAGLLEGNGNTLGIMSQEELDRLRGEDLVHRLESAKKKAEEAASAASSMVEQSQTVWDDIKEKQRTKNMSTREGHLASSLAAVSAAASVAKAAAAAANVAYAAALQARAMANEIVLSRKEASNFDDTDPTVTHVTQGDDRSAQLKSAISGAKVATKQHVEATALAFTKAENLEAVVRAAELAAQAASQAGKVMSLGDPVSLTSSEKNAKPGGRVSGKRNTRSKTAAAKKNRSNVEEEAVAKEQNEENSAEGEGTQGNETAPAPRGDEVAVSNKTGAAQGDVVDAEPSEGLVEDKQHNRPEEITVGSHVEIVPDEDGLQGVWFSAKVKTLNGDDALVVYDELLDDDGNGKLEEWVNITSRIDNVPRVRTAHPMTKDGGMRKRRRASQGSQKCYVGDHVDVWMRDGWWEGVVQSVDESLVTVFFPGDGDTEATKSWNLRPSLVWKDDAWVLWRDTLGQKSKKQKLEDGGGNLSSQELETPETPTGKRKKLDSATPTPGTSEAPTPTRPAARAKPTKRRKFSDVIEKDQEARDASLAKQQTTPPSSSRTPKQQQGKLKKSTPSNKKSSPPPKRTRQTSSAKSNDEGEVRKSGRMIHPTSKLLEGLETTPKPASKKSGTQQSAS
ncbi:uncharacterized protein LOC112348956 [Selaginella moellendorffii]|uniref:uncharacterized protein LOC112348956 n=1 Tax=Selaginella moellendorffii TaxID=88036 RepID=UPI000D1C61F3|nr:uncharacterized protein LOC112348956 [Selaginella moellendorffii]|eukprot:XP_024538169.1 uncharacterized protein LOC112348956 [Selaginella moellendorffii]